MVFNNLGLIALGILLVGVVLIIAFQSFRLIFDYQITNDEIVVRLFHVVPIYRFILRQIETLREAPVYEVALVPACICLRDPSPTEL